MGCLSIQNLLSEEHPTVNDQMHAVHPIKCAFMAVCIPVQHLDSGPDCAFCVGGPKSRTFEGKNELTPNAVYSSREQPDNLPTA
jgi:hypothetical protein